MKHEPRVCDYEGSPYRTAFWETADRSYEDATERLTVRSILPPGGGTLLDIGAGFGRLVNEYGSYERVLLLDYAHSMLKDARDLHGDRCTYVCADLYHLPFVTGSLDTVVQVRVLHHVERIERAFEEVARSLRPGGSYLLEHANKRHMKAVGRYLLGRQSESPFDESQHEFVPLNWDFHPAHVCRALRDARLFVVDRRAVSHFRMPIAKRLLGTSLLARLDSLIGMPLAPLALAPSQFLRSVYHGPAGLEDGLWRCPSCGHEPLAAAGNAVPCPSCGRQWPIVDGIHVFREDVEGAEVVRERA